MVVRSARETAGIDIRPRIFRAGAALFYLGAVLLLGAGGSWVTGPGVAGLWRPAAGLAFGLLLFGGLAFLPMVAAGELLSALVAGQATLSAAETAVCNVAAFGLAAAFLRRRPAFDSRLGTVRDAITFIGAALVAVALSRIAQLTIESPLWRELAGRRALDTSLAELVGVLAVAPLGAVLFPPRVRAIGRSPLGLPAVGLAAALVALVALIFFLDYHTLYLLLLALVWITFRTGTRGAVITVPFLALCIAIAARWTGGHHYQPDEILIVLLVLAVTGLLSGSLVTEETGQIKAGRTRNRAILDSSLDAVLTIDETGAIESANAATERLFGYRPEELRGKDVSLLMPELHRSRHGEYLAHYLQTGEAKVIGKRREVEGLRKDGVSFPLDLAVSELGLEDRRLFLGVLRDLTEQKRVEGERERERHFLSMVLETVAALIVVLDREGRIVRFNPACEKASGYGSDEAKGRVVWEFLCPPDQVPRIRSVFQHLREGKPPIPVENDWVTRDGGRRTIVWRNSVVYKDDGAVEFILGTGIDVTEQRKFERGLLQAQKMESLGLLAGGIAHDFNNFLLAIRGFASAARRDAGTDSRPGKLIARIEASAEQAGELVHQLLAYGGEAGLSRKDVDLSGLVRDVTKILRAALPRRIFFEYELASDLPPVYADPVQLRQIVMNLVTNAADACKGDKGRVLLKTTRMEADGAKPAPANEDGVVLEVADNGAGMDAWTRQRIFDPFFSTKGQGRGLGLAAVFGIVRAHKGRIEIDTEPGNGTTFRVLLPSNGEATAPRESSPEGKAAWKGEGRILVADDDEDARYAARLALEGLGFESVVASSGRKAVALMAEDSGQFAAAVLDLTMPGMDGVQTCQRLRELRPDLPVVIVSGFGASELADRLPTAGIRVLFLQKPYSPGELSEKLRLLLQEK